MDESEQAFESEFKKRYADKESEQKAAAALAASEKEVRVPILGLTFVGQCWTRHKASNEVKIVGFFLPYLSLTLVRR